MLDLTTTLDPRFNIAYRFGSVFLSEPYPSGPGRPDLSIALLEKGLRTQPTKWALCRTSVSCTTGADHDYRAAAEAFRKASEMPGAPWWLALARRRRRSPPAAIASPRGGCGTRFVSRRKPRWLRKDAERRLTQLRALDEIDASAERGERLSTRRPGSRRPTGRCSCARGRFAACRSIRAGTPYELTPDGQVTPVARPPLAPLPTEPVRQMGAAA